MPGLWLGQHLDESLLRAVASIELNGPLGEEAGTFIHDVITGNLEKVQERVDSLKASNAPAEILGLMDKSVAGALAIEDISRRHLTVGDGTWPPAARRQAHKLLGRCAKVWIYKASHSS